MEYLKGHLFIVYKLKGPSWYIQSGHRARTVKGTIMVYLKGHNVLLKGTIMVHLKDPS